MDEPLLREISEKYLLPFFSGARIELKPSKSTPRESTASFVSPQLIGFKVNRGDAYRLQLKRDQPFAKSEDPAREIEVVKAFVDILGPMENALASHLKDDLLSTFQRRVVAKAVGGRAGEKALLAVIDQMAAWATRLYEGSPISSAVGLTHRIGQVAGVTFSNAVEYEFCAVLSNGYDTILEFDQNLTFVEHKVLPSSEKPQHYCPSRLAPISAWTSGGIDRIAVVLNRLGEILVLRQSHLLFARRSGIWHFLTHEPVIRQMGIPQDQRIRQAIYDTALDASFARTGACIGVVGSNYSNKWEQVVVKGDRLTTAGSTKAETLSQIVGKRRFQSLPRALRQELVAIDGATVLDHEGRVLAVGAILHIEGGSTGGGRTAAARALGSLGLGVKVSQDGGITGYRWTRKDRVAFRIM